MTYLVREAMQKSILTIDGNASLLNAVKLMVEKRMDSVIVLEKDKPTGIITESNIVVKVISKAFNFDDLKAREVMMRNLMSVNPDTDLYEAVKLMREHGISWIPVIKDDIVYGIVGPKELAECFNLYLDQLIKEYLRTLWVPY